MNDHYEDQAQRYAAKPEGYYELSRPEMLKFVPESARSVLEVGCSSGAFGALVKSRQDCEVWGIEPNSDAAKLASTRLDKVISGTFQAEMPELKGRLFDCIVFNDVLEHVPNPEKILEDSKKYLTSTGLVVASIPNILHFYQIVEILYHQDWRYREDGIMDNTHLRFFTRRSIVRTFETSGFQVLKIGGINASYGLKYRIANLILAGHLKDWKYVQFAVQARPISA